MRSSSVSDRRNQIYINSTLLTFVISFLLVLHRREGWGGGDKAIEPL